MEKRVVVAIVLAVLVMVGWTYLFPTPKPVPPVKKEAAAPAAPTGPTAPAAPASTVSQAAPSAAPAAGEQPGRKVSVQAETLPERDIDIDTSLYSMVMSTKGAVVKSFKLKKYKDASGQPLEMVAHPESMLPLVVVPEGKTWQEAEGYGYR